MEIEIILLLLTALRLFLFYKAFLTPFELKKLIWPIIAVIGVTIINFCAGEGIIPPFIFILGLSLILVPVELIIVSKPSNFIKALLIFIISSPIALISLLFCDHFCVQIKASINNICIVFNVYETDGTTLVRVSPFIKEAKVPEGITSIGSHAFSHNIPVGGFLTGQPLHVGFTGSKRLESVYLPDGVTTIGDYAFYECENLTGITIPESVTTIGKGAFAGCNNLTSITIPDGVTSIGERAFFGCNNLTSITIPDSVTTIGDYTFHGCESLTSITIPDSVTTIGDYAFYGCKSLTDVTIFGNNITIGGMAFYGCERLQNLQIYGSGIAIAKGAFHSTGLTEVTIPAACTEYYSFPRGCRIIRRPADTPQPDNQPENQPENQPDNGNEQ